MESVFLVLYGDLKVLNQEKWGYEWERHSGDVKIAIEAMAYSKCEFSMKHGDVP